MEGVGVIEGVSVCVGVDVSVGVEVNIDVGVSVTVGVILGITVLVGDRVSVRVGITVVNSSESQPTPHSNTTTRMPARASFLYIDISLPTSLQLIIKSSVFICNAAFVLYLGSVT
jgi:hypothetical protein